MLFNFSVLIAMALASVTLTIVGGIASSEKKWVRRTFLTVGPALFLLTVAQGLIAYFDQKNNDRSYMVAQQQTLQGRRLSDSKIDALFLLLRPTKGTSQLPVLKDIPLAKDTVSIAPVGQPIYVAPDGYLSQFVVTTTTPIFKLRLIVQCNKKILGGKVTFGGVFNPDPSADEGSDAMDENPNMFSYFQSFPGPIFNPAQPITVTIMSLQPVKCDKVMVF